MKPIIWMNDTIEGKQKRKEWNGRYGIEPMQFDWEPDTKTMIRLVEWDLSQAAEANRSNRHEIRKVN